MDFRYSGNIKSIECAYIWDVLRSGVYYPCKLDMAICNAFFLFCFFVYFFFKKKEIPEFTAINVDPNQQPQYVVFDLGLHC